MQHELVCRHLQGMHQAEAELQGKGAPAAPKLDLTPPKLDLTPPKLDLTPPYSEGPSHLSGEGGELERVNTGQLSSAEGEKRGHSNAAQLPETDGVITNLGQSTESEARQTSTRNRAGLTIECSSPRTQSPRLKIGGEIGGEEIGPIPANVRGALILPTDLDGSRSTDLEDSWKGEILPGFLYLGDRMMATDMDRLMTLKVHSPLLSLPRRPHFCWTSVRDTPHRASPFALLGDPHPQRHRRRVQQLRGLPAPHIHALPCQGDPNPKA